MNSSVQHYYGMLSSNTAKNPKTIIMHTSRFRQRMQKP